MDPHNQYELSLTVDSAIPTDEEAPPEDSSCGSGNGYNGSYIILQGTVHVWPPHVTSRKTFHLTNSRVGFM